MISEIVHGRTFFTLASYLFSLVQGFIYCVQYMKPCVQYFSILFFFAYHFKCRVWKKSLYHGMNIENINDWGECQCSFFRPEMSYQLLKRHFWPNSFKVCFIFFVPWLHYRIKGKINSIFILESYSHLSESFSAFC